jgi:hypothetical protein
VNYSVLYLTTPQLPTIYPHYLIIPDSILLSDLRSDRIIENPLEKNPYRDKSVWLLILYKRFVTLCTTRFNIKQDTQCKYKSNFVAHFCKHCCSGRAVSITYSENVFVALVIQHAMRIGHIVVFGPSGSTIFFSHYLINGTIFGKKCF